MSIALEVGNKLVDLCRAGKNLEAVDTLYADNIVSVEAVSMPSMPQTMQGKAAIRGKNQWWIENHDIHSSTATGPWPNGDQFVVLFKTDVTPKMGPMQGKRMTMEEVGLYTVQNGKITKEEFFYALQ